MASKLVKARIETKERKVSNRTFNVLKRLVKKNPAMFNHDPENNKIGRVSEAEYIDGELVVKITIFEKKENPQ